MLLGFKKLLKQPILLLNIFDYWKTLLCNEPKLDPQTSVFDCWVYAEKVKIMFGLSLYSELLGNTCL